MSISKRFTFTSLSRNSKVISWFVFERRVQNYLQMCAKLHLSSLPSSSGGLCSKGHSQSELIFINISYIVSDKMYQHMMINKVNYCSSFIVLYTVKKNDFH